MSSDEFQGHNVYRYSRKTYKKTRKLTTNDEQRDQHDDQQQCEVRNERFPSVPPGCSCDPDPEEEIANILHKKCPVITLAQQQLQKLLEETDRLLNDNARHGRSLYGFLCMCKELLSTQNKGLCFCLLLAVITFFMGVILGAASCGTSLGRFNSPLLTCIDNYFIPDKYATIQETFRSIA